MSNEKLAAAQEAAKEASERMMAALIDYSPCAELRVSDIKFISEWTRTLAFSALEKCGATR